MSTARWLERLGWLAAMAVAVWLVRARDPKEDARVRGPAVNHEQRAALAASDVRAIVHDELARQLAALQPVAGVPAAPVPASAPPEARDDPELPPVLVAQADEASALIERAIGAGRWTMDDRRRFAQVSAELPPRTQIEMQRRLHVAINRGQVATEGMSPFGPPVP